MIINKVPFHFNFIKNIIIIELNIITHKIINLIVKS